MISSLSVGHGRCKHVATPITRKWGVAEQHLKKGATEDWRKVLKGATSEDIFTRAMIVNLGD
jgi:hypothetical protein